MPIKGPFVLGVAVRTGRCYSASQRLEAQPLEENAEACAAPRSPGRSRARVKVAAGRALCCFLSCAQRGTGMKILAVGESYMPSRYFRQAFAALEADHEVEYLQIEDKTFTPTTPSELRLKEWLGVPSDLYPHMAGVEALVVQGAPVTDAVLDASAVLRFVGCARGGPVNVDVEAVSARGLPLVNTPGKNAEAVADQTLAFMIMVARGFPRAQRFLDEGHQLKDNWDGAQVHRQRPAAPYARSGRLRADRTPGGAPGAGLRDEGRGLRPLRCHRPG